jgi:hypothetical protein
MNVRQMLFALTAALALIVSGLQLSASYAQSLDPRPYLLNFIRQMQTGTPSQGLIGPALWNLIAQQTGGSGYYPVLAALGPVTEIAVQQQVDLPQGTVFAMTSRHAQGICGWHIGIGSMTGKIEYSSFFVGSSPPALPAGPSPAPSPGQPPGPTPQPTPSKPPSDTPACQKYPDLC